MRTWFIVLTQLLVFSGRGYASACSYGGLTTLSASYTAGGSFSVLLTHPSTSGSEYCSVELTKWNGEAQTGVHTRDVCSTFTPAPFTKADIPGTPEFVYGSDFTFVLKIYPTNAYSGTPLCSTSSVTLTPAVCRGANYALTTLSVFKRPYEYINAMVTNRPASGQCFYYLTQWAGTTSTTSIGKADCSQAAFTTTGFTYSTDYTVKMLSFVDAVVDRSTTQPLCGINPVTVTPTSCAGSVTATNTGVGALTVSIAGAGSGRKCEVYLTQWNDSDEKSLALTKTTADCSSVTFSESEIGASFIYGTGSYSFEYAEFPLGTANTGRSDPACSDAAASFQFATVTCTASSLSVVTVDTASLIVNIDRSEAKSFGVCRVTLTSYDNNPVSVVRVGACTAPFAFSSDGDDILYAASKAIKFKWEFFANGDISTSSRTCASLELSTTIDPYICPTSSVIAASSYGTYAFSIPAFQPMAGSCSLLISGCGTGAIDFASCSASLKLSFDDIAAVITGLAPGDSCSFKWKYTDASSTVICDGTANTAVPLPILISTPLVQSSAAPGTITLTLASTLSTAFNSYSVKHCQVELLDCDGTAPLSVTTHNVTSCLTSNSVDFTGLDENANCRFTLIVYDTDPAAYGGYSGIQTFSAASVPQWVSQKPTVSLYGEDCIELTWDAPSTSGGAPVQCYEVQRKDGAGSYYVIQTCSQDGSVDERSVLSCGFTLEVAYLFQVIAINRIGRSADAQSVSDPFQLEYALSAPASVYTSPGTGVILFVAGGFPTITVQENNPTTVLGGVDTDTTDRLFVGRLLSRCKLDATTSTITIPLIDSDPYYTSAELPIPPNSPPAFTQVFTPVGGSPGVYHLDVASEPPAGYYSMAVHSLETGGLYGQYWANPFFADSPTDARKDPLMNFAWGNSAIINSSSALVYDLVSIRWTGFIEAAFTETYTFTVDSNDHVRVWIDDVLIINQWADDNTCGGQCTGRAGLEQSVSDGVGSRKFHYIRIDYYHSKGATQRGPAALKLSWASFSQPKEVIPTLRLFKGLVITGAVRPFTVIPDAVSAETSIATLPIGPLTAGLPYSIAVTAKDQFGNVLASADSSFVLTVLQGATTVATAVSVPVDAGANNGLYTIPFSLDTANNYQFVIKESVSANAILGSGGYLGVVAGAAYAVDPSPITGSVIVGVPIEILMDVNDLHGNAVAGTDLTTMPDIFVSAEWVSDSITQGRLPYDDIDIRAAKYGNIFTDATISWSEGDSMFKAVITLYRAGAYDVEVGIRNGADPTPITGLTVDAATVSSGSYSIVTSTPFPPTDLTAGVDSVFTVQLRDKYMNAIADTLTGTAPTVVVRLETPTTDTETACVLSGTDGEYTCTLTPHISGVGLALSILSDNYYASYLYSDNGVIKRSRGPWTVTVSAGQVSAANSLLFGVRSIYTVGISVDATLILRDAYYNVLGALGSYPTITADLDAVAFDPATFTYNADGSITIPIVWTGAPGTYTLRVLINSVAVTMPYGIDKDAIVVELGAVSAPDTTCDAWVNVVAGASDSITCTPMDVGAHALDWPNLYVFSNFTYKGDATYTPIVVTADYNAGEYDLGNGGLLTRAGTYSVYTLLSQPGGLIGQYYADTSFAEIIGLGVDGAPEVDDRHEDEAPLYYTRIDEYVDLDYSGPIVLGGLTATSIRWSGMIMPPATKTYTFHLTANGGLRVQVGSAGSQIDLLTAESVDETFVVDLTSNVPVEVLIEYLPTSQAAVSFKWVYDTSSPATSHVVPPSVLLAPLTVDQSGNHEVAVTASNVSQLSTAYFPTVIIAGQANFIIVQATDAYGNHYSADPTACVGGSSGTTPTCLFQATMSVDDGTTFGTAVALGDGTIKIPVTFAADGPKSVNVKLQTADTVFNHIQGSPYPIIVQMETSATT